MFPVVKIIRRFKKQEGIPEDQYPANKFYDKKLLSHALPKMSLEKFQCGKWVRMTWKERLVAIFHFRFRVKLKFVPDIPEPTGKVYKWRRYDEIPVSMFRRIMDEPAPFTTA